MRTKTRFALGITLAAWGAAASATAVDGVTENNAARAEAGGVTAGDAPGFPVSITSSGSSRLTSNLVVLWRVG